MVPLGDKADGEDGPGSASIAAYLELLQREIAQAPAGPPLSTVYFGGGTPSMLSAAQVAALLDALRRRYGLASGAEITLEMDPASFSRQRLAATLAAGVNRVSLGGQSFDDGVLEALGRRHRQGDLLEAAGWLRQAQRSGALRSWSLDLIQAAPLAAPLPRPGEPPPPVPAPAPQELRHHWRRQLERAIALKPPHLSVYDLIVEPGTVFERLQRRGTLPLPDVDTAADLMELSQALLTAAGYGHYEVSNYALPGHASRHNRVYWSGAGWWGFGLGATSAPWGRRLARPRTREAWAAWLQAGGGAAERLEAAHPEAAGGGAAVAAGFGGQPIADSSVETSARATGAVDGAGAAGVGGEPTDGRRLAMPFDELLLVGLRRREGVNLAALAAAEGLEAPAIEDLRRHLADFERSGLLRIEGPRWRLSDPEGLALSNAVLRELLLWWERSGR